MKFRLLVLPVIFVLNFPCLAANTDALVEALTAPSHPWERQQPLEQISRLDETTKQELIRGLRAKLKDKDIFVRQNAAEALGACDEDRPDVIADLQQLSQDHEKRVSRMALVALARLGHMDGSLIKELSDDLLQSPQGPYDINMSERFGAANDLSFIALGHRSRIHAAIPALEKALLEDQNRGVRIQAAWALGADGKDAQASLPALEKASHDPDRDIAYAASLAIRQIRNDR